MLPTWMILENVVNTANILLHDLLVCFAYLQLICLVICHYWTDTFAPLAKGVVNITK